jgi:shikimate kinase
MTRHQLVARRVLIIGSGGTGKTYTVGKLRARGVNAFDADAVPGLARFVDDQGKVQSMPEFDEAWFSKHHFVWVEDVLKQLLRENECLYLFGTAENAWDLRHLFDRTYYLQADRELVARRLASPERNHPMGATAEQRAFLLKILETHDRLAEALGLPTIDASLSPEEIFEAITRMENASI